MKSGNGADFAIKMSVTMKNLVVFKEMTVGTWGSQDASLWTG